MKGAISTFFSSLIEVKKEGLMKVLILDKVNGIAEKIIKEAGLEAVVMPSQTEEELCGIIKDYAGVIVRNTTRITKKVIENAPNLKIIARAGVGVDNIDVESAALNGIWVVNSPNGNTEATAEHTIAMMLACARNIPQSCECINSGNYERSKFIGVELYGKKLGIIGFGKIGKRVAEIAKVLGMKILVYDPFADVKTIQVNGYEKIDNLESLLPVCDFVTVHVPKNKDTIDLINEGNIYKIKKGARLINCARGGIINEKALKEALNKGHIAGAALDVFVDEPEIQKSELYKCSKNLIIVPHLGASTQEAQIKVADDVSHQVADVLSGKSPKTPVNRIS